MATPRPFGAPTTWTEPPSGEVTRQVQRMKDLKNLKNPPKAENFFQEAVRRVREGLGKPPAAKTPPKVNQDVKAAQSTVRNVAGTLTGLVTSPWNIATTLATNLTSGEDQRMKWKRLGYPSKEHYDAVVSGSMTPQQVKDGQPVPGKFADLRGSETPGSTEPADTNAGEGTAMDSAGEGNGYPEGVVRPMDYTTDPGKVQPSSLPSDSGGSGGSGGSGERTNSEGLVQYGQTLGGLNTFNEGFLGEGYDIADVKDTYQSEALPGTLAGVTQLSKPIAEGMEFDTDIDVSYSDKPLIAYDAKLPDSTKPFASVDSYTPYSTGGNPDNAQDGASPKPDRVERIRQVAFNDTDFSGDEPDDSTLVSPMYANKQRNEIRRTFLDYEGSSVKAAVAANAQAGFGKDSNGKPRFNVGGELVSAKEGMEWKAKDAAMRGVDPSEFLQMKVAKVKEETEE